MGRYQEMIFKLTEEINTKDIALDLRKESDAFAILYGWQYKDKPYIDIYPEEHSEESLRRRINQIVRDYDRYSERDSKGNRYAKESDFRFDVLYTRR